MKRLLLPLLLVLLWASSAFAISGTCTGVCVQAAGSTASSGGSIALAFPSNNTSGNLSIVIVQTNQGTDCTGLTVTDSRNTYSSAITATDGSFANAWIWYSANIGAGANTVTVDCHNALADPNIVIAEFSGVSTSSPLDKTASATYSFSLPVSGTTATTAQASELLIGGFGFALANAVDAGSGWTEVDNPLNGTQNRAVFLEYKTVAATGTYTADSTDVASGTYAGVGLIATFKNATGGTTLAAYYYRTFVGISFPAILLMILCSAAVLSHSRKYNAVSIVQSEQAYVQKRLITESNLLRIRRDN